MKKVIARIFLFVALLSVSAAVSHAQQPKNTDVVYVIGNVKNPSGITIMSEMRLRNALESAGGVKHKSSKVRVAHYRLVDGESKIKAVVNMKSIEKKASQNVLLEPYDIIDVSDKDGSFGHASGRVRLPPNFPASQAP